MIRNLEDLHRYQKEDLAANGLVRWRWWDGLRNPAVAFERKLRWTEYLLNTLEGPRWKAVRAYCRWSLRVSGMKLGFTIPPNVFGPGLALPHWGTIVINPNCRVGARCRMHPGVCLGWHDGKVPTLGDDCYLGPGAKLYGGVVLGNKTKVGPNAVVGRSYPEGGAVLVAPREHNVRAQREVQPEPKTVDAIPAATKLAEADLMKKIAARHVATRRIAATRNSVNRANARGAITKRSKVALRRVRGKN
jgi:serine O-acetyltransferase